MSAHLQQCRGGFRQRDDCGVWGNPDSQRPNEGVILELLDVLANEVGVEGVFSDWPATVTFYANCLR
jgi:hypothetical protein